MTLVLVEVENVAAVQLLRLQGVRVVGILEDASDSAVPAVAVAQPMPKPSIAGLIGTLSDESAERMRTETTQIRSEWEREF